ncbi:MAG: hypothetical protein Fues2KO_04770 [Fuerstiella sp.]
MFQRIFKLVRQMEAVTARIAGLCTPVLLIAVIGGLWFFSPPAGIVFAVILLWPVIRHERRTSLAHGSAAWASVQDLVRAGCLWQRNHLPLGVAVGLAPLGRMRQWWMQLSWPWSRSGDVMDLSRLRRRRPTPLPIVLPDRIPHVGIYGASGSMKTTAFAIQQLLQCEDSTVVLDPKGELGSLTAQARKSMGHRVVLLDPFEITRSLNLPPDRFNPLLLSRENPARVVDDARRLANAMVVRTGKENDEFWPNASVTVLTSILAFLMSDARPEEANLSRMRDILSNPELIEQMLCHMEQSDACHGLLSRMAGQVRQLEGKTRSSVLSVASSHTDFLDSIPLAVTLLESTFDPHELITGRMTIYVCLPVQRLSELMGIQRVIISSLINLVFEAGEDRDRRIRFLLDESASLGPMDSLYAMIMFGRSYGLRSSLLFQSMSQIERCFPESQKDDFLGTTASVICGATDLATAKMASEWMGNYTELSHSEQSGLNSGDGKSQGLTDYSQSVNHGISQSSTANEISRALMRPEEVLQMPPQLGIVLLPNVRPILIQKVPYFAKASRRFFSRSLSFCVDVVTIACTIALIGAVVWFVYAGHAHPLIVELAEQFDSI